MNEPASIAVFRCGVAEWLKNFANTTILVVLQGHAAVETGELIYAWRHNKMNKYSNVQKVRIVGLSSCPDGCHSFVPLRLDLACHHGRYL
jgi:hypothetical protein